MELSTCPASLWPRRQKGSLSVRSVNQVCLIIDFTWRRSEDSNIMNEAIDCAGFIWFFINVNVVSQVSTPASSVRSAARMCGAV